MSQNSMLRKNVKKIKKYVCPVSIIYESSIHGGATTNSLSFIFFSSLACYDFNINMATALNVYLNGVEY